MRKPHSLWQITHKDKSGNVLLADKVHNALTIEGEAAYLSAIYQGVTLGNFYIRLFNDTPAKEDMLGNLAGEPAGNGYVAQLIERSSIGWPVLDKTIPIDESGIAQGGGIRTIILAATASAINDFYTYSSVEIVGGAGTGQRREIVGYDGSTGECVLDRDWLIVPDNTSLYTVYSDYYILSKAVTFGATGAGWGPVTHAVLVDAATGITGKLLAYFPLTTARTLLAGDTLEFSGMIKFK